MIKDISRLNILFDSQQLAVLATQEKGAAQPYTSLVGFAITEDAANLIFATGRNTRKFNNLIVNPCVALLIDDRSNTVSDFNDAVAVTVIGKASETCRTEEALFLDLFLKKHPNLKEFVNSTDCTLIKVKVEKYIFVSNFETVQEIVLSGTE